MKIAMLTTIFLAIGALAAPVADVANTADDQLNPITNTIIAAKAYSEDAAPMKRSAHPDGFRVKRDELVHAMKRVCDTVMKLRLNH